MRGIYTVAGVVVLSACVAGWAALAETPSGAAKSPAPDGPQAAQKASPPSTSPTARPDKKSRKKQPGPAEPEARAGTVGPMGAALSGLPFFRPLALTSAASPTPTPVVAAQPAAGTAAPAEPTGPAPAAAVKGRAPAEGAGLDPRPEGAPRMIPTPADPSGPAPAGKRVVPAPSALLPLSPDTPAEQPGAEVSPGRQEPAVSLEWRGEPTVKVGQALNCTLVVRNTGTAPVQQVLVRVRVPAGLGVAATDPPAPAQDGVLAWELGTLLARQERSLRMKLVAGGKGDVMTQAWVTFTGSSVLRIKVREPRLVVKASAPGRVLVGDPTSITLTVSNPGDGPADLVRVHALLSEGLEHTRGSKVDVDVGSLAAGESRDVTLLCNTRAGGVQKCEATAEAEGGLSGQDTAEVHVVTPRLDLNVSGPSLRYLERKAVYTFTVTNPGDTPAANVTLADAVPDGFKVLAASDGGRHDFQTRTVSWFLGEVGPGQRREVKLEVQAVGPGVHHHRASAVGARGLKAEAGLTTRVEGLSALQVDVADSDDPVELNGDTSYEVRVTNTGSKTETDIKLVATVPDRMELKGAQGPAPYRVEGKAVVFDPLPSLEPHTDAVFRVNVKALDPGPVLFKIQVTSTNLVDPVIKMEATRIYADTAE